MNATSFKIILAFALFVLVSCNKDKNEPESEFYFECYFNGERFVNLIQTCSEGIKTPAVFGYYNRQEDDPISGGVRNSLSVFGISDQSGRFERIEFSFHYPDEGKYDSVYLFFPIIHPDGSRGSSLGWIYNEDSWVVITKFDTVNQIVSGTFQFIGQGLFLDWGSGENSKEYVRDVKITEGRFNAQLYRISYPPYSLDPVNLHHFAKSQIPKQQTFTPIK